jgi:hypothetical protein
LEYIHKTILKVWNEDIKNDYEQKSLLREDTLKNAFYFHLRRRLGEEYLITRNLRIYTEYQINKNKVDLVVVEIDPVKAGYEDWKDCVIRVLISVEMKYKNRHTRNDIISADVDKISNYITDWGKDTKHYLAVIQEKYYAEDNVKNWITVEKVTNSNGNVTELFAYWDNKTDKTIWRSAEL